MKLKHPKKLFVSLLAGVLTLCPLFGSFENIKASSAEPEFISEVKIDDNNSKWHIDEYQIEVTIPDDRVIDESTSELDAVVAYTNSNTEQLIRCDQFNVPMYSQVFITMQISGTGLTEEEITQMKLTVKHSKLDGYDSTISLTETINCYSCQEQSDGSYELCFYAVAYGEMMKVHTSKFSSEKNLVYKSGSVVVGTNNNEDYFIEVDTPGEDLLIVAPKTCEGEDIPKEKENYEKWAKRLAVYANSLSETTGAKNKKILFIMNSKLRGGYACARRFDRSVGTQYTSDGTIESLKEPVFAVTKFSPDATREILKHVFEGENYITWAEMHEIAHCYKSEVFTESFIWGMDDEDSTDELFTNLRGLTAIQNCDNLHCDKPHDGTKECTETGCTNIITAGHVLPYDRVMDVHQDTEDIRIALAARFANIANGKGWDIDAPKWKAAKAKEQGWNVLEAFYNPPETYKYSDNEEAIRTFRAFIGKTFKKDAEGYKKFAMILYALYDIAQDKGVISLNMKFSDFLTEAFGTYQGDSIIKQFFNQECSSNTTADFIITKQPANVSALAGGECTTTVTASVDGLTYRWYYCELGLSEFIEDKNVTGDTYSVTMKETVNGRQVFCEITDKYGNIATTNTVTLEMAKITKQPQNACAKIGKVVSTKVETVGDGLEYQWYVKNPNQTFYAKSSIKDPVYTYVMTEAKDGRKVYCVISDMHGNEVTTETVILGTPVEIVEQPKHASALLGKAVKTTVTAKGHGLEYQWYVKNPNQTFYAKSSIKDPVYTYVMTEAKDGRQVYCEITDLFGNKVRTNTVTLGTPVKIVNHPENACAEIGEIVSTKVEAAGHGLKYQWYVKNPNQSSFVESSIKTAIYSYEMMASKDGRQVYCEITDMFGNCVTTGIVTLGTPVKLLEQPKSASAKNGSSIEISVNAQGHGLKYAWYICHPGTDTFVKAPCGSSTYSFIMRADRDGRQMHCVITDMFNNSVQTDTVTLTMSQ